MILFFLDPRATQGNTLEVTREVAWTLHIPKNTVVQTTPPEHLSFVNMPGERESHDVSSTSAVLVARVRTSMKDSRHMRARSVHFSPSLTPQACEAGPHHTAIHFYPMRSSKGPAESNSKSRALLLPVLAFFWRDKRCTSCSGQSRSKVIVVFKCITCSKACLLPSRAASRTASVGLPPSASFSSLLCLRSAVVDVYVLS